MLKFRFRIAYLLIFTQPHLMPYQTQTVEPDDEALTQATVPKFLC
jgi:hypothetical protein